MKATFSTPGGRAVRADLHVKALASSPRRSPGPFSFPPHPVARQLLDPAGKPGERLPRRRDPGLLRLRTSSSAKIASTGRPARGCRNRCTRSDRCKHAVDRHEAIHRANGDATVESARCLGGCSCTRTSSETRPLSVCIEKAVAAGRHFRARELRNKPEKRYDRRGAQRQAMLGESLPTDAPAPGYPTDVPRAPHRRRLWHDGLSARPSP